MADLSWGDVIGVGLNYGTSVTRGAENLIKKQARLDLAAMETQFQTDEDAFYVSYQLIQIGKTGIQKLMSF